MNKKNLLQQLLEYPKISTEEYNECIKIKNNLDENDSDQYNMINNKINLYIKKEEIINLIKTSPIIEPDSSIINSPILQPASPIITSPLRRNFV
jgi:hypothetical protein